MVPGMAGQWLLILKEARWSKEYLFHFLILVNGYIQHTHTAEMQEVKEAITASK